VNKFEELKKRLDYIKDLYKKYKLPIKQGEGLSDILILAEKIVNGSFPTETDKDMRSAEEAFHYVWTLAETMKSCVDGLDVSNHLARISTGTVDYGIPANGTEIKKIFYKDFECELFVASVLIKGGHKPSLLDDPSSSMGEMKLNNIYIEVKHPNSSGQLEKLLRKFNSQLYQVNSYGIFAVGIENMFSLGNQPVFDTYGALNSWLHKKNTEIEDFIKGQIITIANNFSQILGLVFISTILTRVKIETNNRSSDLARFGNAAILKKIMHNDIEKTALIITEAFKTIYPLIQF
jgi:hypothetical protein